MSEQTVNHDYRALRRQKGLNQQLFWNQVGVTQSGGSRYENERSVPAPVAELVRLHHELGIDTRQVTPQNAALIRAILSEQLDAETLLNNAERCRDLMDVLGCAAQDLGALAASVNQTLGTDRGVVA
ncbi:helix-turn-helix domain-containing protein [Paludibacterium yongneupense]|uniref:helix-turn-helix domain-containing protein n=1 Tax=Paludibacterium yongneupense TaxID=400061 RepID=UPI0004129970|nr:helix-turn-helix transcriptional regulator [Paludibacterium yongneupense]